MAEFEALGGDVYCVDAQHVRPRMVAIYLLISAGEVAVIDTGTRYALPNLQASLAELDIDPARVRYVIPTHVHLDHAGGAGAMMGVFDQAQLIVHPRGARHLIDPRLLVAGSIAVYGEQTFRKQYGEIEPVAAERVVIAEDNDVHRLGDRDLRFIDTPGHARHHFCIFDAASGDLFSGDTFGVCYSEMKSLARGLLPTSSPVQFDPDAMRASLRRIEALAPERVLLTHYGAIDDPLERTDGLLDWVDRYVELCTRVQPRDAAGDRALQSLLQTALLDAADGAIDSDLLLRLMDTDLRLNADGLGHWWRQSNHG